MFLLFALLAVMNNAVMSIMHKFVGGHYVFISLGYIPTSGIARSYGHSMFNFWGTARVFFGAAVPFYIPTSLIGGVQILYTC